MLAIFVWMFDLLSNFRLHLTIFSVIGIAVSIVVHSVLPVVFFLVLLVCMVFPLTSWVRKRKESDSSDTHSYSVCSFNIEWNAHDHEKSLAYIKNSSVDFLALQEVPESLGDEIRKCKSKYPYQYGEGHSHVMILSKHELEFVEYLPWPGKFQQRALHVTANINDQKLNIFVIHLQVTRSWKEVGMQKQQLNVLKDRLQNLQGPVLLLGDFNAGTGSNLLRRLESMTGFYSNESLFKYKRTWPSNAGPFGIQLDHIFCNQLIKLNKLDVGPVLDSDHRPIQCDFSI